MVEFELHEGGRAVFDLSSIDEGQRGQVAANMQLVAEVLADGEVTMEEAAQLLALGYPDLAGHPQLASVLQASSEAVQALRDDGRVSLAEGVSILLTLLAGVPSLTDLSGAARALASRLLALRRK